ncbi:arf-GAP with coiled-coil, ANK repeat and PH domain-containing protein 2 isoform X2 [Rhizophagus clarus]|uniref:Arf-GAP with coiled-coil, ANK repeat and PH domain-containing protein 2 isoform X2 n=1 Tax=Rhizophagus clarus TaxID=94130 RepID=A0A8H3M8U2_9GLOM|nr:arf-GAP with coiled-coil, ANK repeat and PH domain-containing protein 2 isoform X2 [Rhizophagus clarus]
MTTPLKLQLCQEDPPQFRKELADCENSVFGLENTIKNLVKLARSSVELASEYTVKQLQFAEELGNFAKNQPESIIKTVLSKYASSLHEVERSRKILHSHMYEMFIEPLEAFAKNEIVPLKDVKKVVERTCNEADTALARYMSKKPKDSMIPDASIEVAYTRREFHRQYIDYVVKLNELEAKKKFEFMEYILALMFTESSFYHQSYDILKDMEPHMKDVTRLLQEARTAYHNDVAESQVLKKKVLEEARGSYDPMKSPMKDNIIERNINSPVTKSGYLFMKGNQRVMQSWTRKYFIISDGHLYYYSRNGKGTNGDDEHPSITLRVCHIKPILNNSDRRFCFEIISPNKTYVLQAENQEEMDDWINCLQTAAKDAIYADQMPKLISDSNNLQGISQEDTANEFNLNKKVNDEETLNSKQSISKIRELPGNDICADCKCKDPQWASTNFGTLLCIECSGIHRSLGVHLGNIKTNKIYEAKLDGNSERLDNSSSWERADREKFITDKYVKKEFINTNDDNEDPVTINLAFWKAMSDSDFVEALRNLSLGANVDWKNEQENSTTALHQAILKSDDVAIEFLLLWFCNINEVDNNGWSALHHAAATNNARLLLTLMKRQADIQLKDKNGKIPLDIAVEKQNVQAVTALRLFQFERQLTRSEYSIFGVDEALNSVSKPYNRSSTTSLSTRSAPATPPSLSRPLLGMEMEEHDDIMVRSSVEMLPSTSTNNNNGGGLTNLKFSLSNLKLSNYGQLHDYGQLDQDNVDKNEI